MTLSVPFLETSEIMVLRTEWAACQGKYCFPAGDAVEAEEIGCSEARVCVCLYCASARRKSSFAMAKPWSCFWSVARRLMGPEVMSVS